MSAQQYREWLTEKEIKNLIKEELEPYHQQNLDKFDKLTAAFNRFQGAIWTVGTLIAGLEVYFKLKGN